MLNTILELLKNKQCDGFPLMQAKKRDSLEVTTYRMIIIHCVLTVLANRKTKHIKFIATLLSSPETLKVHNRNIIIIYPFKEHSVTSYAIAIS